MDDISHNAINIEMLDVVREQAGHGEEICKSTARSNHLMDDDLMMTLRFSHHAI